MDGVRLTLSLGNTSNYRPDIIKTVTKNIKLQQNVYEILCSPSIWHEWLTKSTPLMSMCFFQFYEIVQ